MCTGSDVPRFRDSQCGYFYDMAMAFSVASAIVGLCTTFALALVTTRYHERVSTDPGPTDAFQRVSKI